MTTDEVGHNIRKVIEDLIYSEPKTPSEKNMKQMQEMLNYIGTFPDLESIPDGCYNFGGFQTGKGGAIELVKALNRKMKEEAQSITIPGIGIKPLEK